MSVSVDELSEAIAKGMDRAAGKWQRGGRCQVSTSLVNNVIGEFNPLEHDVDDWVNAVDEFAVVYNWNDATICHLALAKLRGPAETWYRGLPTRLFLWREWRDMIRENFKPKRDLHGALKKMMDCKPQANQSLYEYVFQKLALIHKLKLPLVGADQVNLIMGGIEDQQIKFAVNAAGINEPHLLAAHFKTFEYASPASRLHESGNAFSKVTHTKASSNNSNHNKQHDNKNESGSRFSKNLHSNKASHTDQKKIQCFNCQEFGHFKRHCPKGDKKLSQSNQNKVAQKNVNFIGASDSNAKFFKTVLIEGSPEKCFIDFGSECSLITIAKAEKLGVNIVPREPGVILTTVGGSKIEVSSSVWAEINLDGITKRIEFFVVVKCVANADLLIGQNFTELDDISYIKTGYTLQFYENQVVNSLKINTPQLNIGNDDPKIVDQLLSLLNEYPSCVAIDLADIGVTPNTSMKIELTSSTPIAFRPRRYPEPERQQIRTIVNDLMKHGIIRESKSPYAFQVLLVQKKTNDWRLCVDYRPLNKITVKDKYPIPLIEEQISRLAGFQWFVSLDLLSGYYQIPMNPESVEMTAFVTQDGHYEFVRMPFGLTNGPAVFQRMVNTAIGQLRFSQVLVYLDDVLIPGHTPQECLRILETVLNVLKDNGLTLRLSKCVFLTEEIEYLGHVVSNSTVRPSSRKTQAVKEFPIPTNVHRVRQFLGLTGYFRKFIANYAVRAKPLSYLLQKDVVWEWGEEQNKSFEFLKESLIAEPVLTLFKPTCDVVLYTDASSLGLAGILHKLQMSRSR
jgi:hypothetical protein